MTDAPLTPEKLAEIEARLMLPRPHDRSVLTLGVDDIDLLCATIRALWAERDSKRNWEWKEENDAQ